MKTFVSAFATLVLLISSQAFGSVTVDSGRENDQAARKAILAFNVQNNDDLLCLYKASWNKGDKYMASHSAFPNALIVTKFIQEAQKQATNAQGRPNLGQGPLVYAASTIDHIASVQAYLSTANDFDPIYLAGVMVLEKYPLLFSNSVRCPNLANVDQERLKNVLSKIERAVDPEGSMTAEERLSRDAYNYCESRDDEHFPNTWDPNFDHDKWVQKCVDKYIRKHR